MRPEFNYTTTQPNDLSSVSLLGRSTTNSQTQESFVFHRIGTKKPIFCYLLWVAVDQNQLDRLTNGDLGISLQQVECIHFAQEEKTITMYQSIYTYTCMCEETNRSPLKKGGRDLAESAAAFRQQLPVLRMILPVLCMGINIMHRTKAGQSLMPRFSIKSHLPMSSNAQE